jgi:hypothetical protein
MAPAALLLLVAAAALPGCAQQVRVNGSWQDDVARDQAYTRVLVVGVSPDYNQRCAFETFLALQIRSESTTVITSCRAMSSKDALTLENIERVIAEHQVDAVLATSLVASKIGAQEGGSSETRGDSYYKAVGIDYWSGYYGAYGMPVVYGEFQTAPPITTVTGEVEILTKVFETRGATLVYELNTKARDLESRESGLAIITGPIAERLRKDGLVR